MMEFVIRFRPTEDATLKLCHSTYLAEGSDPVAAYSRLLSACLVAGAVVNLRREDVLRQVAAMYPKAVEAVEERVDIFGAPGRQH